MPRRKLSIKQKISLAKIRSVIWANRMMFFRYVWPATFVLAFIVTLSIPSYYHCHVKLSPEVERTNGDDLVSLAEMFGIDVSELSSNSEALVPLLYPDLIATASFTSGFFSIPVTTIDGELSTTYYDYLLNYRRRPWWFYIRALLPRFDDIGNQYYNNNAEGSDTLDLFYLNMDQDRVCGQISGNINCSVDEDTYVIDITVEDQDPLICAVIADSACHRLQERITEYRTQKALTELRYTQKIYDQAEADYLATLRQYNRLYEANSDAVRRSALSMIEDLENDLTLKYTTYSLLTLQLQAAQAKVQEKAPAFTVIQVPAVPNKPAGPNFVSIFIRLLIFTTFFTIVYIIAKEYRTILS